MKIEKYITDIGLCPFDKWINKLKDKRAKSRILIRLDRVKEGNLGNYKSLGDDIYELRIPEGKGYRIYYGHEDDTLILLLCGGNKSSQSKDIKQAKKYWSNYHGNI
jgi:putative addiction module killer protein